MSSITRIYGSADDAARAVHRLRAEGFPESSINTTGPLPGTGGSTARPHWAVTIRPLFGMGRTATELMDRFNPVAAPEGPGRDPGVEAIHRLSHSVSPGAISDMSRSRSPGAVASLSRAKSPGAISSLSRSRSAGAIASLSRSKPPGAISRLSRSPARGAVARLSSGWYFSDLLGLPLLTRSQAPIEPDSTLLSRDPR